MNRGDVVLVRFPHPSGQRGKKRPAVVVQSDIYLGKLRTVIVAQVTKNLLLKNDPACLFIEANSAEAKATGLITDSVISALVLNTVYTDAVDQVLGKLSSASLLQFDTCLKVGFGLR